MNVYKRKKALEIWRKFWGARRAWFLLLFLDVTIVWEEYTSEDTCVTKRQASVGPPKISRLHLRNSTLLRVAKVILLFRALMRISTKQSNIYSRCCHSSALINLDRVAMVVLGRMTSENRLPARFSTDHCSDTHAFLSTQHA